MVYGVPLTRWALALAVLASVYVALTVLRGALVRRFGALAASTVTSLDDLLVATIGATRRFFILAVALYFAMRVVPVNGGLRDVIRALLVIAGLVQAGVWGSGIIGFVAERYARQRAPQADLATRATVHAVGYAVRTVLWVLLGITGLDFFGVKVTALVTGLGIGGVAVALAAQNILGDLFAALAIVLDQPFALGDFIIVGDTMGTVEHIGLKTTRIRALSGEQIAIANGELLKGRIRNFGRMNERRVVFTLDVTYDTPPDTVATIPGIVRDVIQSQKRTRFDRCHFLTFADSSLRVETVYYVLDRDFNIYADIHHAINLELLRRFNAAGIQFAFPTRTVVLSGNEGGGAQVPPSPPAGRSQA